MSRTREETLLHAAFAPARSLEPSAAEVAAALARAGARRPVLRSPSRRISVRLAAPALALVALIGVAYAVPPTRATIDNATESVAGVFDGWGSGDSVGSGPGRALDAGEPAPSYFREGAWSKAHDPRVIAEAGGYRLYAYRERSGGIGFDLGDTGVGMGGYSASDFDGRAICLLGPGTTDDTDPHRPRPFFGVAAPEAGRLELAFAAGPPESVAVDGGGFVLLFDRPREPTTITAFDSAGQELGQAKLESGASYC